MGEAREDARQSATQLRGTSKTFARRGEDLWVGCDPLRNKEGTQTWNAGEKTQWAMGRGQKVGSERHHTNTYRWYPGSASSKHRTQNYPGRDVQKQERPEIADYNPKTPHENTSQPREETSMRGIPKRTGLDPQKDAQTHPVGRTRTHRQKCRAMAPEWHNTPQK